MKLLLAVFILIIALPLYAQEPLIKIYLNDGSQVKEYNIEDIAQIDFIKSSPNTSMIIYQQDTTRSFLFANLMSLEYPDLNKLKINLLSSSEDISIADIDSIIFVPNICTVVIGTQTWMCRNLDVDHYRNGDPIPEVKDSTEWYHLTTGAWCYNNNDPAMGEIYGKLYNWNAVNDPRGLAPEGWHIPSDEEWTTLSTYLGGDTVAGGKFKETGTAHWKRPNTGATNETGFSALPVSYRNYYGKYYEVGICGFWWSSTMSTNNLVWLRQLYFDKSYFNRIYSLKENGMAVRCVKD